MCVSNTELLPSIATLLLNFYLTCAAWHQPKDSDEAEDGSQASDIVDDSSASDVEAPDQEGRKPRSGKRRQILIDDDDEPDDIESFEEDGSRSDNDIEVAQPTTKKPENGTGIQGSIESFFGKLPLGEQFTACR